MLLRLALTSTVGAGRVKPRGQNVHNSGRPSGTGHPAERYARAIGEARSEREARAHLAAAQCELQSILRRPFIGASAETRDRLALRIVTEGTGMSPIEVAILCKCTTSFVRAARIEHERAPEHGRSLAGVSADKWAHELRAAGYSYRQVAALTGIPRSTLASRASRAT